MNWKISAARWQQTAEERAAAIDKQTGWAEPHLKYLAALESNPFVRALMRLGLLPRANETPFSQGRRAGDEGPFLCHRSSASLFLATIKRGSLVTRWTARSRKTITRCKSFSSMTVRRDDFETRVASYRKEPRVLIVSQENRGLPATRNAGVHTARGEYFKFLDADDWLTPDAVSQQVSAFNAERALGFVYNDLIRVDAAGKPLDTYSVAQARHILDGDILPSLLLGGYFTPHTVLVPRRVLEQVGLFDETLGGAADFELWMRIVCEGYEAHFVPAKLAYYRLHDKNMTRDTEHMDAAQKAALDLITTRYPHQHAGALDELIREQHRIDEDSQWAARSTCGASKGNSRALKRALATQRPRGVHAWNGG